MTETQFAQAKEIVWSNITTLISSLGHPPTDVEFLTPPHAENY